MQKHYILACLLSTGLLAKSQDLVRVSPGTDLYVSPGTTLFVDSLAMTPAVLPFTITNNTLSQYTTIAHTASNPYVRRVYRFANNTAPFTGTIDFFYKDDELNGLSKPGLILNIHDNTSWGIVPGTLLGALLNQLQSSLILAKPLNELTLSSTFSTLPLVWGAVGATRQGRTIRIDWATRQESNLDHFTVERSTDARTWSVVTDQLPGTNTGNMQDYQVIDPVYQPGRVSYRVKQTDYDGNTSYSAQVQVLPVAETRVRVYPNPVNGAFFIDQLPSTTDRIQLFNMQGAMIRQWTKPQAAYPADQLAPGIYQLRILLTDGSSTTHSIHKR